MSPSLGWTLLTTRSPIEIVPEVMFASPASIRKRVDFPQPDGPTRTTKAPSSIGIETPCKTSKPPNDLRTSRICTDDILPTLPKYLCFRDFFAFLLLRRRNCYQTFPVVSSDQSRIEVAPLSSTFRSGGRHATIHPPVRILRTKTRRVRCGRNHDQSNQRDQTQAPLQRMVQQPA